MSFLGGHEKQEISGAKVVEVVAVIDTVNEWWAKAMHDEHGPIYCGVLAWQGGLPFDKATTLNDCLAKVLVFLHFYIFNE